MSSIFRKKSLKRIGRRQALLTVIKKKIRYSSDRSYVLRHTLHIKLEGKIEGQRCRGKKQITRLKNIQQRAEKSTDELTHVAIDRTKYSEVEANLRSWRWHSKKK